MSSNRKLGVLIAEDESEIRTLVALFLESEDFTVYQAADGQAALDLCNDRANEIDILLTDLGLPGIGGVELIEQVRLLRPSIKIIGTTGFGRANVREEVTKAGGDEFIAKPFLVEDLVVLVKKLAGRS
jgi:two-component system, response regulator, stage 0 sporulation protein F